jgi:hypothetical protein
MDFHNLSAITEMDFHNFSAITEMDFHNFSAITEMDFHNLKPYFHESHRYGPKHFEMNRTLLHSSSIKIGGNPSQ